MDDSNEVIAKLISIVQQGGEYFQRCGDEELLQRFWKQFPKKDLKNMSIEQYVMGKGSQDENFSWWLERGLTDALGRYSLGNASRHVIYRDRKTGDLRILNNFSKMSASEAMDYVAKLTHFLANTDSNASSLSQLDDVDLLYDKANLAPIYALGMARRLRIVSAYNPDTVIPITSIAHIRHFLKELGCEQAEIPSNNSIFQSHEKLYHIFESIKEQAPSLTPYGFMKALYSKELGIQPMTKKKTDQLDQYDIEYPDSYSKIFENESELNTILYGPPGTGKTFTTIALAVKMADPEKFNELFQDLSWPDFFEACKEHYDKLYASGRIVFTTFHQSFSYEDFIEGIRAETTEGGISYSVGDGVFKAIANMAASQSFSPELTESLSLENRRIWKMSLGNTLRDEADYYDDCIQKNYIGLGWGGDIDFSDCHNRSSVKAQLSSHLGSDSEGSSFGTSAVHRFKNVMKRGDIIVISDGNHKYRAIAEVTGDYEYSGSSENDRLFSQCRSVRWVKVFDTSLPKEILFKKSLSQMALYELGPQTIKMDKLSEYLTANSEKAETTENYVLVIDEINRGNISRIFGELITLLEPSKRKGCSEEKFVTLPYSKEQFSVPDNLYVLGTMNTADKSLAQMDLALRRRFSFEELTPMPELLSGITVHGINIGELLDILNQRIEVLLDRDHMLGHAYFWPLLDLETEDEKVDTLATIFSNKIMPLLQEYFFSDWERIGWVLNDSEKPESFRFIQHLATSRNLTSLFSSDIASELVDRSYRVNTDAFNEPEAYQGIFLNDPGS